MTKTMMVSNKQIKKIDKVTRNYNFKIKELAKYSK